MMPHQVMRGTRGEYQDVCISLPGRITAGATHYREYCGLLQI